MNPNLMARGNFNGAGKFSNYPKWDGSEHSERRRNRSIHGEKWTMTRFKILGAAAILSMMFATPVFAQAAIQEPGAYAFYHPNADVLNSGRPSLGEALGAMASVPFNTSDSSPPLDGTANPSSSAH